MQKELGIKIKDKDSDSEADAGDVAVDFEYTADP